MGRGMGLEDRLSVGMLADRLEGWQALYRLADGLYASLPESERRCIEAGGLVDPTEALHTQIAPILARLHPHVRAEIAGTIGSAIRALRTLEAADEAPAAEEQEEEEALLEQLGRSAMASASHLRHLRESLGLLSDLLGEADDRLVGLQNGLAHLREELPQRSHLSL